MPSDRWREVEKLYQAVVELEPSARQAFLDQSGVDEPLRREVESLIGCDAPDERLVEIPALFDAGSSGDPSDAGIAVRRIGPYPDRTDRSRGDGRAV